MIPVRAPNQAPSAGAIAPKTPGSFTAKGNNPQVSVMTDDVIEGRITENSFRRAITALSAARVLGTLFAQLLLVPAALAIARVAELI